MLAENPVNARKTRQVPVRLVERLTSDHEQGVNLTGDASAFAAEAQRQSLGWAGSRSRPALSPLPPSLSN